MFFILGMVFVSVPTYLNTIKSYYTTTQLYSTLSYTHFLAIALDEDAVIYPVSNGIQVDTTLHTVKKVIPLLSSVNLSINGAGKLGFKSNGNAQYAGTCTVQARKSKHQVRVEVGNGFLTVD